MDYKKIFKLIDLSNAPWVYNNRRNAMLVQHYASKQAELELVRLGVYNRDGELITQDQKIIDYYEEHWL